MITTLEPQSETTVLAKIVGDSGLNAAKAQSLIETFTPIVAEAGELVRAAEAIVVTDATQVTEIKAARSMRLKLRSVRVRAEEARKALKQEALNTGRAIDAAGNWIKGKIEPEESRLQEAEEFAERAEAKRKADLRASRENVLRPFGIDVSFYNLSDMPEAAFAQLFESSRLAHEARIELARKAEEARIAAEAKKAEEDRRIRAENERLRKEAEAAKAAAKAQADHAERERLAAAAKATAERRAIEAKANADRLAAEELARKEREAAAAKLTEERAARRRLEEAATAKANAEAERIAKEKAAKAKAARAPDKTKIIALAVSVVSLELPNVSSPEAASVISEVRDELERVAEWIKELASKL